MIFNPVRPLGSRALMSKSRTPRTLREGFRIEELPPFKAVVSNDTCADRGSPKKDRQPSFLYSLCCKIMYVRVRHSPSTHHAAHAGTIRMAYKVEIFNILDMNFREFLTREVQSAPLPRS